MYVPKRSNILEHTAWLVHFLSNVLLTGLRGSAGRWVFFFKEFSMILPVQLSGYIKIEHLETDDYRFVAI